MKETTKATFQYEVMIYYQNFHEIMIAMLGVIGGILFFYVNFV
jgi:hypothetical protein